jgi:SAM-dependent methyltransferase
MNIFGDYSKYYNLLYKNKEYSREVDYISKLINEFNPDAKTILDLGCGTGRHDELFVKYGYSVYGIDISEEMLKETNKLAEKRKLSFIKGDIRNLSLDKQFDVVVSLFHVISYQTTNEDLKNTFETASKHLKNGGLFIFDCWYGPAVLSEKPTVRVKRLEDENIKILRVAEPIIYPNENLVDVNYEILVEDKKKETYEVLSETHTMRYLFKPEIEIFMENTGLRLLKYEEWLSGNKPGFNTWGVMFLGLKN